MTASSERTSLSSARERPIAGPIKGSASKSAGGLPVRVLSSIALAPPALGATYLGGPAFAAVITFAAMVMVYEWARMVEREVFSRAFFALAAAAAAALISSAGGLYGLGFAFCGLGFVMAAALSRGDATQVHCARAWAAFGALYIIAPCIALLWLRGEVENGRALTFALFVVVWMADIGAYTAGRVLGGPRISPALSPEKTWSGVFGGVLIGGLAGAAAMGAIYGAGGFVRFLAIGGCLGLASVLGDLAESAFKRAFGVKDSSNLIPGHGGFLDRLDGMIFATTAMTSVIYLLLMLGRV